LAVTTAVDTWDAVRSADQPHGTSNLVRLEVKGKRAAVIG
jgi:hypothetical protein